MTGSRPMTGDLIERLEKAGVVGDREIDAELWLMFTPGATRKASVVKSSKGLWPDYTIDETREASGRLIVVPKYTTSLDAALALAERVLPGWTWMVERHKDGTASAWLHEFNAYGEGISWGGQSPALALCIAILKARTAASSSSPGTVQGGD